MFAPHNRQSGEHERRAQNGLTPKELAGAFMEQVVAPVSRNLPGNLEVSTHQNRDSAEFVLKHTQDISEQKHTFAYIIRFTDAEGVSTPPVASLTAPNVITVPNGEWSPTTVIEIQNAWRRMTIADPALYRRFTATDIELSHYQDACRLANLATLRNQNTTLSVMATGTGKTISAFDIAAHLYEAARQIVGPDTPLRIPFIVNNNTILRQSEETLQKMFGGRFSAGRIYEGEMNLNGDFIFITPASLNLYTPQGRDRMAALLESGVLCAAIFDEVHHLPAGMSQRLLQGIQTQQHTSPWQTKILGFTATETRRDNASVIKYFGGDITFEYDTARAIHEGFLVPVDYRTELTDKNLDPAALPIFSNSQSVLYGNARFEAMYDQVLTDAAEIPLPKALLLAHRVERAGGWTRFVNSKEGLFRAERLTSPEILVGNPPASEQIQRFRDAFHAIRHGTWPADSRYSGEPIPNLAATVDALKEGADVADLTLLHLFRRFESRESFQQALGRGLRPAPLKTKLIVRDSVRAFDQPEALQFLSGLAHDSEVKTIAAENALTEERAREKYANQDSLALRGYGVAFSGMAQDRVTEFREDISQQLQIRYEKYSLVPLSAREQLDEQIRKNLGLKSEAELIELIREVGTLISSSGAGASAPVVRATLLPAFVVPGNSNLSATAFERLGSQLIFDRLTDHIIEGSAIQTGDPEHEIASPLTGAFPEFTKHLPRQLRTTGVNLTLLRERVFRLEVQPMLESLVTYLVAGNRLQENSEVTQFLTSELQACLNGDVPDRFLAAEKKFQRRFLPSSSPLGTLDDESVEAAESQRLLTTAYTLHPILSGIVTEELINGRTSELEKTLRKHKLIVNVSPQAYRLLETIDAKLSKIAETIASEHKRRAQHHCEVFESVLQYGVNHVETSWIPSESIATRAHATIKAFHRLLLEDSPIIEPFRASFETNFAALMRRLAVRYVQESSLRAQTAELVAEFEPENQLYQLTVSQLDAMVGKASIPLLACIRSGPFKVNHVIFQREDTSQIEDVFETLDPASRLALVESVVATLQWLNDRASADLLVSLPRDNDNNFFTLLRDQIRDTTTLDYVAGIGTARSLDSASIVSFSCADAQDMRISFLTPERVKSLRGSVASPSAAPYLKNLRLLYLTHVESRDFFADDAKRIRALESLVRESNDGSQSKKVIASVLAGLRTQPLEHKGQLQSTLNTLRFLEMHKNDDAPTAGFVSLAALYYSSRTPERWDSKSSTEWQEIRRTLTAYYRLIKTCHEQGLPFPTAVHSTLSAFAEEQLDAHDRRGTPFPEGTLDNVNAFQSSIAEYWRMHVKK